MFSLPQGRVALCQSVGHTTEIIGTYTIEIKNRDSSTNIRLSAENYSIFVSL